MSHRRLKIICAGIFLLCVCTWANAMDSVAVSGFWTRYSKTPRYVVVDSVSLQRRATEDAKRVRFIYNVDFSTYFDNREYKAPYQIPQTFLNFRLSPQIGVRVCDRIGGVHELVAGVRYTQPLGGDWRNIQIDPTAYYHFKYQGFDVGMGAIPYENRISPLPDWLMYDSLVYMHPNIQGALMSYRDNRGYVEFMCDWRGSQTTYRREMFRLVVDGQYHYKWLMVGGLFGLNHKAGFAEPNYEAVMDDINLNAFVGVNLTSYTPLDSLSLQVGYIFEWERDRATDESVLPQGMLVELYARWWFLGLKNTFYYGDNLQPFRSRSVYLNLGDPFYQSRLYNRTDLMLYLYRSSFVNFYFSWNMHYDIYHLQHQQQLIVRFNLDGVWNRHGELRGLFDK